MLLTPLAKAVSLPFLMAFFLATASPCRAQSDWLTVVGYPDDPVIDTVQVQLEPRSANADMQNVNLRVNRAATRTSTDGVVFRSFVATAEVDCTAKKGRFTSAAFYTLPLWRGDPHKSFSFPPAQVRPMLFRDITPNPTERIIRAACPAASRGHLPHGINNAPAPATVSHTKLGSGIAA